MSDVKSKIVFIIISLGVGFAVSVGLGVLVLWGHGAITGNSYLSWTNALIAGVVIFIMGMFFGNNSGGK